MAKDSSFDVVSQIDMQEVDNAFGQAKKEISQRYDLKDSGADIALDKSGKTLTVSAPSDFVNNQVKDVLTSKLIKRGIALNALDWGSLSLLPVDRFAKQPRLLRVSIVTQQEKSTRTSRLLSSR